MLQGIKNTTRSSIIYGLGNVSTKLVGLVLLPLYTNTTILTVDDYAVMGLVDVTIQLLVAILSLSLYQAYFRWYWDKEYENKRKSLFFTIFSFLFVFVTIFCVLGTINSVAISQLLFNKSIYSKVVILMLTSTGLQILTQLPQSLMRLQDKAILYTTTNVLRLTANLVLTVILITRMGRGLAGIYEAQILGNIFFFVVTSIYIYKNSIFKFHFQAIKEMLQYSLPLTVASVSGIFLASVDRYVLQHKSTLLDVAIYTTAFKIANTVRIFIIHSIQLAVAPTIFRLMNHPNRKTIYARIMTYFSLLVIFASLGLSVFGKEVLELFSTDSIYVQAYKLIPLLCVGILLGNIKDVAINGLNIVKKTKVISLIVPSIAIFHFGLNIIIIPYFGVYGAAIASIVSQGILMMLVLYFAQKHYPVPYEYGRLLLPFGIAASIVLLSNYIVVDSLVLVFAIKAILVALFPLALWVIPYLNNDEKQWISGFARKLISLATFKFKKK